MSDSHWKKIPRSPIVDAMKAPILLGLLVALTCAARAADTAYSALRVVGKRDGQDTLNRVLELRARGGTPHPAVWKVVIDEPRARGGVREIEVQRGRIIGERTPTARTVGAPMNFNQLNLDSEGAFTIADQEAHKAGLPFDRVDYLLKSGTNGGAPVWELELFETRTGRVGLMTIAADSGTVLRRQLDPSSGGIASDREYLEDRNNPPGQSNDDEYRPADEGRKSSANLPAFIDRVGRHFQKRGRQLENFFTGK
jgi:hypothetical protein